MANVFRRAHVTLALKVLINPACLFFLLFCSIYFLFVVFAPDRIRQGKTKSLLKPIERATFNKRCYILFITYFLALLFFIVSHSSLYILIASSTTFLQVFFLYLLAFFSFSLVLLVFLSPMSAERLQQKKQANTKKQQQKLSPAIGK